MTVLFAQSTGEITTDSASPVPLPGLTITLPRGSEEIAIVTVNLPSPWASGGTYPGGWVGITVDGVQQAAEANFTSSIETPGWGCGRIPTTLVTSVPLTVTPQVVQVVWHSWRGCTARIDSPSSVSAVL